MPDEVCLIQKNSDSELLAVFSSKYLRDNLKKIEIEEAAKIYSALCSSSHK